MQTTKTLKLKLPLHYFDIIYFVYDYKYISLSNANFYICFSFFIVVILMSITTIIRLFFISLFLFFFTSNLLLLLLFLKYQREFINIEAFMPMRNEHENIKRMWATNAKKGIFSLSSHF